MTLSPKIVNRVNFRSWRPSVALIPWIWGLVLAVTLTGRMVYADFCIIDDHWQALWLGGTGGFSFAKIWPTAVAAELGSLGSGGRYRPVWILYLELEAWLFGDRPALYHALRILYFALFLGALGRIAARCVGLAPALVFVTAITGLRFWGNLWTLSLGPLEQLAVAGVALLMIACDAIVPRFVSGERIPAWALPLASLGTAVAAGSKENFVFLVALFAAIAIGMAITQRLQLASAVLALPGLVVPAVVLYALASAGGDTQDFYGVDNSVAHRLAPLLNLRLVFAWPFFVPFVVVAVLLAVPLAWLGYRRSPLPRPQRRRAAVVFIGFVGFLAGYTLWEIFFYNGRLPSGIRYDFPILLLPPAIVLGFAAFTRYTLLTDGRSEWRSVQAAFVAFTALYLVFFRANFSLPRAVDMAVARTTVFRHDFDAMRMTTSAHPDWPIVLEPNSPWDYEPVDRFHVWARYFGIANPLMLRVEVPPKGLTTFEQRLVGEMQRWAAAGVKDSFRPLPDPTALEKRNGHCLAVGFWHPIVSPCVSLDFAPNRYIPHG
jgi:hypothetical protein